MVVTLVLSDHRLTSDCIAHNNTQLTILLNKNVFVTVHKMLLHSYRFWQQLALPICFGSLHGLLFVHLIVIPGNIPQLGLDWFMMAKNSGKTGKI